MNPVVLKIITGEIFPNNMIQRIAISMPLSYWEEKRTYWKIPKELLLSAQKRKDGIIGRIKDGTILKIGSESNKKGP